MQTSTIIAKLLKHLPLLVVMIAAIAGSWLVKDLYREVFDSRTKINETPLQTEQLEPQFLSINEAGNECLSTLIYTSLPPKCRSLDGTFIPLDEFPSNNIVVPERK